MSDGDEKSITGAVDAIFRNTDAYRSMVSVIDTLMVSIASLTKSLDLLISANKALIERHEKLELTVTEVLEALSYSESDRSYDVDLESLTPSKKDVN